LKLSPAFETIPNATGFYEMAIAKIPGSHPWGKLVSLYVPIDGSGYRGWMYNELRFVCALTMQEEAIDLFLDREPVAMQLGDLRLCGYLTAKRPYDDLWGERRGREGSATPSTEVASTWTQASGSRCSVSVC
jgi:hypothetical protein